MDPLSGLEQPADAKDSEYIENVFLKGYVMKVLRVKVCEDTTGGRSAPHNMYRIIDPDGNADWLCSWDCVKVEGP